MRGHTSLTLWSSVFALSLHSSSSVWISCCIHPQPVLEHDLISNMQTGVSNILIRSKSIVLWWERHREGFHQLLSVQWQAPGQWHAPVWSLQFCSNKSVSKSEALPPPSTLSCNFPYVKIGSRIRQRSTCNLFSITLHMSKLITWERDKGINKTSSCTNVKDP